MSEPTRPALDGGSTSDDSRDQISAGAMLRRAREEAGLHIGALAVSLKVPVKKLEALEADRVDLLPDTVFARALAGTVCRTLKIDPAPVLAAFPQTSTQRQLALRTINKATFKPAGHGTQKSMLEKLSRPFVILGFAFAIGALVLMFFPSIQQLVSEVKKGAELSSLPAAQSPSAQSPAPSNTPVGVVSSTVRASTAIQDASPVDGKTMLAGGADAAIGTLVAPELKQGIGSATMESTEILKLTARGTSWVEVTDAKRLVVLRKTMVSGESQNLGGSLPMTVVLGRANLLDVHIRGQAFDLVPTTKDNVSRFEVK